MKIFSLAALVASYILVSPLSGFGAETQRPGAPHLFPEDTLAYARIDDANEYKRLMRESSIGRMLNDPELRPFVEDVYGVAADLFERLSERVGISLDELLKIPQGELAVALIPLAADPEAEGDGAAAQEEASEGDESPDAIRRRLERRRRAENAFGFVALIESGDSKHLAERLLTRLGDQLVRARYVRREISVGDTEFTRYARPASSQAAIEFCQRDGVTMIGVGEGILADVLARWEGEDIGPTLAQSADFAAAMGPCIGAEDTEPQLTFFANPYELIRRVVRRTGGPPALAWPLLEEMGIARFRGIAGSSFAGGDFLEGISHFHVLLDTPRDGLLSVVRPSTGDISPPSWVPSDVMSYTTLHWDFPNTYAGVGRILDRFQGEDSLQRLLEEPLQSQFNLHFKRQVIDQLTGRVTVIRWHQPPARLNSQTQMWGFEVKDPTEAVATLETLAAAFPGQVATENEGSVTVYVGKGPGRNFPDNFRRPTPCVALLGSHVLVTDSREFLKRAIRANAGALQRLKGVSEYDVVAAEVGAMLAEEEPFLFSYLRAEEMLRQFYEVAASPRAAETLRNAGESNPVMARLAKALIDNPLPPYDTLKKYFAPSGAFAYDSPTGIHYTTFSIKAP